MLKIDRPFSRWNVCEDCCPEPTRLIGDGSGTGAGVETGPVVGVADARAVGADEGAAVGLPVDELSDAQPHKMIKTNRENRISVKCSIFKDMSPK
jgi:hypothetical protein